MIILMKIVQMQLTFDLSSTMSAKLVGVIINQPTFLQSDGEQKVSDTVQKTSRSGTFT